MKRLLALAVCFVLAGCSSEVEKEFMAGCRNGGVPKSTCSCMYDTLKPDLEKIESDPGFMRSEDFWKRYIQAGARCQAR